MATKKPNRPDRDRDSGTQVLERKKTKKPDQWRVIMFNDDYTTQEFVVYVLKRFFKKDDTEATQLMLRVHMGGQATVATYTRDIAETKVAQVTDYAREQGHPLMLSAEPT